MTKESPLEQLRKASANAKAALDQPQSAPAAVRPVDQATDQLRKDAYKEAIGGAWLNKNRVDFLKKYLKADFKEASKFTTGVYEGSKWMYEHVLRPVARGAVWPMMKLGGRSYVRMFNALSYVKNEDGEPTLSKKRAAGIIGLTVAAGIIAAPVAGELGWSTLNAGWWAISAKSGMLYLHNATPTGADKYVVVGCDEFPCSDSNSVSFQVDDSWFHDARHFVLHGTPFRPDAVAAAVPPVPNKCEATWYGWRWRLISRTLDLWPRLLEASCTPINMNDGSDMPPMPPMSMPAKGAAATPAPAVAPN